MKRKHPAGVQDVVRALFEAPFKDLPPAYGDTVPPELRVFEAQAEEAQHYPREAGAPARPHHGRSKPVRVGSGPKPLAA